MKQKVYTYMLYSEPDKGFYIGITRDTDKRLATHNRGGVVSTRDRRPLSLVYSKKHESYDEARQHEKWLKKKNKEYKLRLAQLAPPKRAG
jgi:putative endonuclease